MYSNHLTSYPKEKIKILFLENISESAVKNFRSNGYVQIEKINRALTEQQLIEAIKELNAEIKELKKHK